MGESAIQATAFARYHGLLDLKPTKPGAVAPGFMLTPASQAKRAHQSLLYLLY